MYEADASMTQMAMSHGRFSGDQKVYAEFKMHPKKDAAKSKEAGRDIFEDVPYVRIMVPGDKDNIVFRPVRETDKNRFPKQWAAFQNRDEQVQEGTPLSEWAGVSRSMVEELKFFGIHTVEALVNMPDSSASKFMGINSIRAKAKAFIEDAKLMAPIAKLTEENAMLKQQMAELLSRLDGEEVAPKRRTRKKVDNGTIQDDQ